MTRDTLLFGTSKAEAAKRVLRAGRLEATWDDGALRWIRWDGVEIIRGILFLVRTPGWGTPVPTLSDVEITETAAGFSVAVNAHFGTPGEGVAVALRYAGEADGHVEARATIRAEVPFETNRAGLIVLHPLDGVIAREATLEHADGTVRDVTIPKQLSPGQPAMDLRAMTHRPVEGLSVCTRFEGDVFEMEDHRNWSDASLKTYNRPIGLPHPYLLSVEEPVVQTVTITIDSPAEPVAQVAPALVEPEADGQPLPVYALPLDTPAGAADALRHVEAMTALAPQRLLLRWDPSVDGGTGDLAPLARLMEVTGAALEIQTIVSAEDARGLAQEIDDLAQSLTAAGIAPAAVAAFPKIDEQSFQPGQERPPHPSDPEIASALGRAFPDARLIGGTPAFFTEFNRKRPDTALWSGLTFGTSPVVHAADDSSVMETLQALPHILTTARELVGDLPVSVGPTGIGMRLNPYGAAPTVNDPDDRAGMAGRDPRQRGLFAAAWTVGYLARIAAFAPERFAFGAPTGPFGLLSTAQDHARAVWDDLPDGACYPLYHVARWIAGAGGGRLLRAEITGPLAIVSWDASGVRSALVANLSSEPADLPDIGLRAPKGVCLDETTAISLSSEPAPEPRHLSLDRIGAFGVLYLKGPAA
ncbi:hypothetical protein [Roseisalinus antarcticus]|uniref:Uncharacterized protein n=1 Tax=Roseisalinus antarcticus TaxID=254357 RepID=A0A1Y5U116_9RHOB|nr:hypothetical protein [Roseisalinus antarcticus]SLN73622.1 hypothetical protein ROA7023_03713 [Roseisalinus antarcticus]